MKLTEYKDKNSDYSDIKLENEFHFIVDKDSKGWFVSRIGLGISYNKKYLADRADCIDYIWEKFSWYTDGLRDVYLGRTLKNYETSYD